MNSLRFAPVGKFAGAILPAIFLAALSAPLSAAGDSPRGDASGFAKSNPSKGQPAQKPALSGRAPSNRPKPSVPAGESAAPGADEKPAEAAHREHADALPTDRPAAPDLLLSTDSARRADALVAFSQALLAEDNAEGEAALAGFQRVLELDPGYAELAVKVAYELARRNRASDGIQVLKDAAKASPRDPLPLIYLSQLYARNLKKPDLALKHAQQALALAPENFAAYLANFELFAASGDVKKAAELLEKAAKVNSKDGRFWVQIADLHARLWLKEDGTCTSEQKERMNAIYRKGAELAGEDAALLSRVADYFVISRQVEQAIPLYLRVVAAPQTEKDPPLNNTREKLARAFLVTDQRDEAIAMLEKIASDNPMRFDTFELLGELYEQKEDLPKALANYQHALLLDASQPRNYLRLTDMLLRTKRFDKAVETMQQARRRFPDLPQVTYTLAIALSQAKRHNEAMTVFAEAQGEAENSGEDLLSASFYFQYGAAAEQAGLQAKAAELLKKSIELDPANAAQAYNYLGYMWADLGENLEEAEALIKKALELDPENGSFIDSLGWLYFKKGEVEKAHKELLRAIELIKPEDAVVYEHLADACHALGKTAEALTYWQKAVALAADDKEIATRVSDKVEAVKQKMTATTPPKAEAEPAAPAPLN